MSARKDLLEIISQLFEYMERNKVAFSSQGLADMASFILIHDLAEHSASSRTNDRMF